MSTIESAACIIADVGCYADPVIGKDGEFDTVDRQNRIAAATGELTDWVRHRISKAFNEGTSEIETVARLVAEAMEEQRAFAEAERQREIAKDRRTRAEILCALYGAARETIEIIQLEQSGIRHGDGYWHGADVIGGMTDQLIKLSRKLRSVA